ncbi:hypothetical protein NWE60_03110 [Mycoplasmopsis felis]|nr:hypothetical protein [Mycoplasmopsis felis]WAM01557.1 hypothetical protein NWE60_03110 [Mycoplasmopsis felis]
MNILLFEKLNSKVFWLLFFNWFLEKLTFKTAEFDVMLVIDTFDIAKSSSAVVVGSDVVVNVLFTIFDKSSDFPFNLTDVMLYEVLAVKLSKTIFKLLPLNTKLLNVLVVPLYVISKTLSVLFEWSNSNNKCKLLKLGFELVILVNLYSWFFCSIGFGEVLYLNRFYRINWWGRIFWFIFFVT